MEDEGLLLWPQILVTPPLGWALHARHAWHDHFCPTTGTVNLLPTRTRLSSNLALEVSNQEHTARQGLPIQKKSPHNIPISRFRSAKGPNQISLAPRHSLYLSTSVWKGLRAPLTGSLTSKLLELLSFQWNFHLPRTLSGISSRRTFHTSPKMQDSWKE